MHAQWIWDVCHFKGGFSFVFLLHEHSRWKFHTNIVSLIFIKRETILHLLIHQSLHQTKKANNSRNLRNELSVPAVVTMPAGAWNNRQKKNPVPVINPSTSTIQSYFFFITRCVQKVLGLAFIKDIFQTQSTSFPLLEVIPLGYQTSLPHLHPFVGRILQGSSIITAILNVIHIYKAGFFDLRKEA